MQPTSPAAVIGDLRIASHDAGTELELVLSGSAELRASDQLAAALLQWHQRALDLAVAQVSVDLRDVQFMNSSALSAFLQWFNELRRVDRYRVRLVYDTRVRWQRGSINALSAFAVDYVTVADVPRS